MVHNQKPVDNVHVASVECAKESSPDPPLSGQREDVFPLTGYKSSA
jgi:hypothetical protein